MMASFLPRLVVLLLVAVAGQICASSSPREAVSVQTTSGQLTGLRVQKLQGSLVQYLGIPYAKPPTGDLRFRPPEELDASARNVRRSATSYGSPCYQPPHTKHVINPLLNRDVDDSNMSEDCLYLNVFVPESDHSEALPVMVWFAGEGFDYADPRHFDPSYLALAGKVIVVTVNYRVSVFGFLSGQREDAPGNAGLWDQIAALRWVKRNARSFGGDSDNITLFGRFTGAISISILMTSPAIPTNHQEKLFHRVILQSGVATGEWVFDLNPMNATRTLAEATGCQEAEDVVQCLRSVSPQELLAKSSYVPQRWRPVFDGQLCREEPLRAIEKRRFSHSVDYMLGFNRDEGSLCVTIQKLTNEALYNKILHNQLDSTDFRTLIAADLQMVLHKSNRCLIDEVDDEYEQRNNAYSSLRDKYVDFCGTMLITAHMEKFAQVLSLKQKDSHKTFVYQFDHRPSFSIYEPFITAGHGDDVLFAFGLVHKLSNPLSKEVALSHEMMKAFSNFARYGDPNSNEVPLWPQYESNDHSIFHFNANKSAAHSSSRGKDVKFWHEIIPTIKDRQCDETLQRPLPPKPLSVRMIRTFVQEPGHSTSETSTSSTTTELIIVGVACSIVLLGVVAFLIVRQNRRRRRITDQPLLIQG